MKVRTGFVSNSSSSSFVIGKSHLTELQIKLIKNYAEVAKTMGMEYLDGWGIYEEEDLIKGSTIMDNFDMHEFLEKIGVDKDNIHWGD